MALGDITQTYLIQYCENHASLHKSKHNCMDSDNTIMCSVTPCYIMENLLREWYLYMKKDRAALTSV